MRTALTNKRSAKHFQTLQTTIIDKVNSPSDVKELNLVEMEQLAGEIRSLVLNKVSQVSGHVGPNMLAALA